MDQASIRNFAIIAHINHGKSTLADRLMEITGTVVKRDSQEQLLDSHPISRERGITIRLAPVTMNYELGIKNYELNLIDTPGHVDFSYEVERSLAACEGAILLVDATQGIQAQTLSHFRKATNLGLTIIPVINKIDSPNARVDEVEAELVELISRPIHRISARTGEGVEELLKIIVEKIPPPKGDPKGPVETLVFSSQYSQQRGVIAFIKVLSGTIFENVGKFTPEMTPVEKLEAGEVGYLLTNIKDPNKVSVWEGYHQPKPMVFVSLFPVDQDDFKSLEDGLSKLKLNDAAITFALTSSKALGRGFRCGFLGHLHGEIAQERLERDFGLSVIATTPTVEYRGNSEPWVKATIITPESYVGGIINLCEDKRGKMVDMVYHGKHATLSYEIPLAEIITDFFDRLKSASSGYASMDYELIDYRPFDAVQLDIIINHEPVDAFSQTMEKSRAERYGKFLVERLANVIPRQQIAVPVQASIDNQIIARADIPAFRKDVTAKLYGGDSTRRMKLLEKQKKGKERMKSIGQVQIPGDTFLKIFRT